MIGLDTNVIVRYLTQDDPIQSKKANARIAKWIQDGEELWICQVTVCEVFWVLEHAYKLSKKELISVLTSLLQTRQLEIEEEDVIWAALHDYEKSSTVGFVDCLIGRKNSTHGCSCTYTFDQKAAKQLASFKLL